MRYLTTADHKEWRSYVERLPDDMRDVHFLPGMMAPYEATGLGAGGLWLEEQGPEYMIWPVLVRAGEPTRHPYNFGGPATTLDFLSTHTPDCECILNPFLAHLQTSVVGFNVKHDKDSVWCDLTQPDDFRQTTRHAVEKSKVTVDQVLPSSEAVKTFGLMYARAMDRLQAATHWRFGVPWFATLMGAMNGHTALLLARDDAGNIVAGCILLYGYGTCYYHFAASVDKPPKGTNHKMVATAIEWARNAGCKRFHLGGGVKPNDGLFIFKSGFSDLRLPVYRYKKESICRVAS